MEERMEVKVLGRVLGTASGWDLVGGHMLQFDDFEPADSNGIGRSAFLVIDFDTGEFYTIGDDGGKGPRFDIVRVCSTIPWTPTGQRPSVRT